MRKGHPSNVRACAHHDATRLIPGFFTKISVQRAKALTALSSCPWSTHA